MDTITLQNIAVETHIGIPDEERSNAQTVLVTVVLHGSVKGVAEADELGAAIDYEHVYNRVHSLAATERKTLERFAEDIAETILTEFKPEKVEVEATKHILPGTDGVTISILRP